jgi:hypothetical protein
MNGALKIAATALLACVVTTSAQAQDRVYRCGADGRSYSQEPCAAGRGVDVADARSAEQAAQARQVAQRDARLADQLQRERLQLERNAARQGASIIAVSAPQRHDDVACRKKGATCRYADASKPQRGKASQVTLYRAPNPN